MQIVIDLPKEAYEYISTTSKLGWLSDKELAEIIKNGKPLPEGHGALKDVRDLKRLSIQYEVGVSSFNNEPIIATSYHSDGDGVWESLYDNAPTILQADKESE